LLSSVEQGSFGEEAKKRIAKRRHDVIDDNTKRYSKVLNSEERMRKVIDYNEMTAGIAEISAEKDDEKRKKQQEKRRRRRTKKRKMPKRKLQLIRKRTRNFQGLSWM